VHRELTDLLVCPFTAAPLVLDAMETDGDEIEQGVLRGPVAEFPIVAGIAVLRGGDHDVVAALRKGDHGTAEALAVIRDVPLSRVDALAPALASLRPTRWLAQRLGDWQRRAAARRARAALDLSMTDPDALLRLTMLEQRAPNPEGYRYFSYRLGLPRHLVALGCLTAARPGPEPVLEVGCGAGHLTWQIASLLAPRSVLALERELDLLWVARRFIAPEAGLVCADARSLPVRSRSCSLGIAVDVLSFVTDKVTVVREIERVVGEDGGMILTSLINAEACHEYAGEPLSPAQWVGLLSVPEPHLYDDAVLLDRYLRGDGPPVEWRPVDGVPRTVTVLAGRAALEGVGSRLGRWPHAIGVLSPHPVLEQHWQQGGDVVLRRASPSRSFDRDNPGLDRYLTDQVLVSAAVVADTRAGRRSKAIDELVGELSLVGFPERCADKRWAP